MIDEFLKWFEDFKNAISLTYKKNRNTWKKIEPKDLVDKPLNFIFFYSNRPMNVNGTKDKKTNFERIYNRSEKSLSQSETVSIMDVFVLKKLASELSLRTPNNGRGVKIF